MYCIYFFTQNNILNKFQDLQRIVLENAYSDEERLIMALPTQEQVLILLSTSSIVIQRTEISPTADTSTTTEKPPE